MSLKFKKGFSVIAPLLGFSLLGLSTVGLATYMGNFEKVRIQYDSQSSTNYVHSELKNNLKLVLTQVQTKVGNNGSPSDLKQKTQGFCKLMNTGTQGEFYNGISDKLYGKVEFTESKLLTSAAGYLDANRWGYFVKTSGWSTVDECKKTYNFPEDYSNTAGFAQCYKKEADDVHPEMRAFLQIIPQKAPNFSQLRSSSDKVMVDQVVYEIKSTLSVKQPPLEGETTPRWHISISEDYLWASQIAECHACNGGGSKCRRVRFTGGGAGSSLAGDIFYHSLYSHKSFADAEDSILKVSAYKNIPQAGQLDKIGSGVYGAKLRVVRSNTDRNIAMACTANMFVCPKKNSGGAVTGLQAQYDIQKQPAEQPYLPHYFDNYIKTTFNFELDYPDVVGIKSLRMTLPAENPPAGAPSRLSGHTWWRDVEGYARVGQKGGAKPGEPHFVTPNVVEYPLTHGNEQVPWLLRPGSNPLTANISQRRGVRASICQPICENAVGGAASPYYPKIIAALNRKDNLGGSKDDEKEVELEDTKIGCTVCYAKSCHRFGAGTFGPINELPDEAIDSGIPECSVHNTTEQVTSYEFKDTAEAGGYSGDDSKNCLALEKGSGKLVSVDCANANVNFTVCFKNGKPIVIKGDRDWHGQDFGNKSSACFRASVERLKLGNKKTNGLLASLAAAYMVSPDTIKQQLEGQGLTVTGQSGTPGNADYNEGFITIYNSASQGLFLSVKSAESKFPAEGNPTDKAWINLERDFSGVVSAGLPFISDIVMGSNRTSADRKRIGWAYFFREPFSTAKFTGLNHPTDPSFYPTSAELTAMGFSKRTNFELQARPARPIFINFKGLQPKAHDTGGVFNSTFSKNSNITDNRLALVHHAHYKGVTFVDYQNANPILPFICINTSGAGKALDNVRLVKPNNNVHNFNNGFWACSKLGGNWGFTPPTTPELWTAALLKTAPNAPHYPFPNPFDFVDGVPFTTFEWNSKNNPYYSSPDLRYHHDETYEPRHHFRSLRTLASDNSDIEDYNKSKAANDKFIFNALTESTSGNLALAAPRAAWIGLVPRRMAPNNSGISVDDTTGKYLKNWMADIHGMARVWSSSEWTNSIFNRNQSAQTAIDEAKPLATGSRITLGIVNYKGVPVSSDILLNTGNHSNIVNKLKKACVVDSSALDPNLIHTPLFIGDFDNWPATKVTTAGDDLKKAPAICSSSLISRIDNSLQGVPVRDMKGADFDKLKSSVRGAVLLKKRMIDKHSNIVFNEKRFCYRWRRHKLRRALGRCVIKKYMHSSGFNSSRSNSPYSGKSFGLQQSKNCRTNHKNNICSNDVSWSGFETQMTSWKNERTKLDAGKSTSGSIAEAQKDLNQCLYGSDNGVGCVYGKPCQRVRANNDAVYDRAQRRDDDYYRCDSNCRNITCPQCTPVTCAEGDTDCTPRTCDCSVSVRRRTCKSLCLAVRNATAVGSLDSLANHCISERSTLQARQDRRTVVDREIRSCQINLADLSETGCKAKGIASTNWSYGTSCSLVNLNVNFDQEGAGKGGENPQCWSLHKLNPRAKFYHPDFGGTSRGGNELGTMANNLCGYVGVVGQDILKGQAGYCTNGNASRPDDGKDTNTQDSNNNVLSMAWPSLKDANCFPNARTTLPASTTNYTCGGHYTDLYGTDADFDDNLCSGLDFSDDEDHCDDSSKNGRGIFVGPSS